MEPIQPIQKQKRVLSEDALTKLAAARVKALEARKHNCAVRREAKAQAQAVVAPVVTSITEPVTEPITPITDPVEDPSSPRCVEKKNEPPRRRQKIVLYSDSDSDDEAIYIKTKRKNRKTPRQPSPPRHSPRRPSPPPKPQSPVREPPAQIQHVFTTPSWMK